MKRNMKDSEEFEKNRTADYEIEHKETPQSKVPSGTEIVLWTSAENILFIAYLPGISGRFWSFW